MKITGLAMHVRHNILFEYCYDYEGRIKVIKKSKPQSEQKIRLRLFKILPEEAIAELPKELVKEVDEWGKVNAERIKAYVEWKKEIAKCKTYPEWLKAQAEAEKKKTITKWKMKDTEAWHKKWCGCEYWKNGEINFRKKVRVERRKNEKDRKE